MNCRVRVASFPPPIRENPYQRLLYDALAPHDVELAASGRFRVGWLWQHRRDVDVLHFHWLTPYYRRDHDVRAARFALSTIRLGLFLLRLVVARLLGYRIIWTVHEVDPHERVDAGLDRATAKMVAHLSHGLITHDASTLEKIEQLTGATRGKTTVTPHPTFAGVYPPGRDRGPVRAELGIADDACAFLCFGHIRGYKDIDVLLSAFGSVTAANVALVIAGMPFGDDVISKLRFAAARDDRIVLILEYVPIERVAELFTATDVAIVSRGDGGTSGVIVLALSLGVPVIAAARSAYEELTCQGAAGWHFEPGDAASLARVMAEVAVRPDERQAKSNAAANRGVATRWGEIAEITAAVLRA